MPRSRRGKSAGKKTETGQRVRNERKRLETPPKVEVNPYWDNLPKESK